MRLDFTETDAAQDMVRIIMRDKGITAPEALSFAVNEKTYKDILKKEYGDLAYGLWGHDDPYRKWDCLDNPIVEVEFSPAQSRFIDDIVKTTKTDPMRAICYFLIFTMDRLGYHI